jgi:hypothetical protein
MSVAVGRHACIERCSSRCCRSSTGAWSQRARLLTGEIADLELADELHEATKLTVFLGRRERVYRLPAYAEVCDLLYRHGIAGATAQRPLLIAARGDVSDRPKTAR